MEPSVTDVKSTRRYDSSRRRRSAHATREAVVDAARRLFLEQGFATTTVAAVAIEAGVSSETVYKSFGSKSGLVRAICEAALAGEGPTHAERRSDDLQRTETDPRAIVRGWGTLTAEVAPRVTPILMLLDSAVAGDPEMATLRAELDEQRWNRMQHNARTLAAGGHLRPGVGLDTATDVLWAYTAPGLYELLVLRRGWSAECFGAFVADAVAAALLPAPSAGTSC
jgi:AcrR family transcriptional regulator